MDEWVLGRPVSLWKTFENGQGERCPLLYRSFASQTRCVVLARSNKPEIEVEEMVCQQEGVPVLRRRGGGGTVVLGPGCVILTVAFFARPLFENSVVFEAINAAWVEALESAVPALGSLGVKQRGISDLAIGDRKIAGTSLFRRKHLAVFQGSLLVNPDLSWIERCLKHPSREPDYRQGRSHLDFVTTLRDQGCAVSAEELAAKCSPVLHETLKSSLEEWAIPAPESAFHLGLGL